MIKAPSQFLPIARGAAAAAQTSAASVRSMAKHSATLPFEAIQSMDPIGCRSFEAEQSRLGVSPVPFEATPSTFGPVAPPFEAEQSIAPNICQPFETI